jgi:hypothetical protein
MSTSSAWRQVATLLQNTKTVCRTQDWLCTKTGREDGKQEFHPSLENDEN